MMANPALSNARLTAAKTLTIETRMTMLAAAIASRKNGETLIGPPYK